MDGFYESDCYKAVYSVVINLLFAAGVSRSQYIWCAFTCRFFTWQHEKQVFLFFA